MPFVNLDNSKKDEESQSEHPDVPAFDPNIPIIGKNKPVETSAENAEKTDDVKPGVASEVEDADFRPIPEPKPELQLEPKPEVRDDGVIITSKPFKDIEQSPAAEKMEGNISVKQDSEVIKETEGMEDVKPVEKKPQEAKKTGFIDKVVTPVVEQPKPSETKRPETIKPEIKTPIIPAESVPPVEQVKQVKKVEISEKEPQMSTKLALQIKDYAKVCLEKGSSDIHFTAGYPVYYRVDGRLEKHSADKLSAEQTKELLYSIISDKQKKQVEASEEIDFMYVDPVKNRFRVNVYWEKGDLAGAFRSIPKRVRTVDELGLPSILKEFSKVPYGLVLVTGPTGSGKSTSIAAMIEEINASEPRHIITIEDPVEYIYEPKVALIVQRNMHEDTQSWNDALRAALRQDPDVVLVGEMRDYETIEAALTIAETGHLVFATLHTNSAAQTIDRIIDVFPGEQQNQVRTQLGNMLSGVISQRLVPLKNGGRKAAMEVLIASNAVKSAIREGKTHQIDNIIQTSSDIGMFTLEKSLVDMIRMNEIDIQTAKNFTIKPDQIDLLLK